MRRRDALARSAWARCLNRIAGTVLALGALVGCGGSPSSAGTTPAASSARQLDNTNAGRSTLVPSDPALQAGPAAGMVRAEQGRAAARRGEGMDPEHPVMTCGPLESYEYVASRFRCPDGSNPLGGDPRAGQAARLGNVGANSRGHIIDVYRIPCPGGPIDVYVDLYGCPEMERRLMR